MRLFTVVCYGVVLSECFPQRTHGGGKQIRQSVAHGSRRQPSAGDGQRGCWGSEHRSPSNLKATQLPAVSSGGERPVSLLGRVEDSYLVDPASSHMLVSKIKPCM